MRPVALGRGDDFLDFLDARRHGAERDEVRVRDVGQDSPERRLARARRAPENERVERAVREGLPKRPPLADKVRLADELVERPRAKALGERRPGKRPAIIRRIGGKEAAGHRAGVAARCRRASSTMRAAATLTLSESTPARIGNVTRVSA